MDGHGWNVFNHRSKKILNKSKIVKQKSTYFSTHTLYINIYIYTAWLYSNGGQQNKTNHHCMQKKM